MTLLFGIIIGVFIGIIIVALASGNKYDEVYREGKRDGYLMRMREEENPSER